MLWQFLAKSLISRPHPRLLSEYRIFPEFISSLSSDIYEYALQGTQYLPQKDLKKIQRKRLIRLIKRARSCIPFYAEYFKNLKLIEVFSHLPLITKKEMRNAFNSRMCLDQNLKVFGIPQFTSGSTGIPFQFFMDTNMLARRVAIYRRMLSWCGKKNTDIVILLMPKMHPGLENEVTFFQCADPEEVEKKLISLYALFENRSIILQSRTSHLVCLAKFLERDKKKFNFKALISYTEMLLPETRTYLERIFGAPIFNYYACNEIAAIAQECEFHDGLHVNSEWVFVEIVDEANNPLPPGKIGYILVTSFDNEVMPFIKYKLGDKGYWLPDACRCGRTLPRIRVEGREDNSFILLSGKIGYLATLMWPLVQRVDKILQYQVIRRSINDFVVRIKPASEFNNEDHKIILKRFQEYLGPKVKISIKFVKKIETAPSGKELAFINLAPNE